jgi:cell division protease FtsH
MGSRLGGRASEEIVFGDVTSVAENDIQRATQLARRMVTQWGMGDSVGTVTMGHKEGLVFLGRHLGEQRNYSEKVAAVIDEEIKGIVGDGYDKAKQILTGQRSRMDVVVERLKVDETVDAGELDAILASVIGPTVPDSESASVTHA